MYLLFGIFLVTVGNAHTHFGSELCKAVFRESNFTSCSPLGIRMLLSHIALITENYNTKLELKKHLQMETHTDQQLESNLNFAHQLIQDEHEEVNGLHLREFVSQSENKTVWQNNIRVQCKIMQDSNGDHKYGSTKNIHVTDTFMHGQIPEFESEFIKIPCRNLPNTHLYFIAPIDNHVNILHHISKHTIENFVKYGMKNQVHIEVPVDFILESHLDLTNYLKQLGIQKMFASDGITMISQTITLEISTVSSSQINSTAAKHVSFDGPFFIVVDFGPDTLFITQVNPLKEVHLAEEMFEINSSTPVFIQCDDSESCTKSEACITGICVAVCKKTTCAANAICSVIDHKSKCKCSLGYTGDPRVDGCTKFQD